MKNLNPDWKLGVDYPEWGNTQEYLKLMDDGNYLIQGETPREGYKRVVRTLASYTTNPDKYYNEWFDLLWKGWLIPSTPVMCNTGTDRGLPISCFGNYFPKDSHGVSLQEAMVRAQGENGGGNSGFFDLPETGKIDNRGRYKGPLLKIKVLDSINLSIEEADIRKPSFAAYMSASHKDSEMFMDIRQPKGDPDLKCYNIHHGLTYSDRFMENILTDKTSEESKKWFKHLKTKVESGEPYHFFEGNVERNKPDWWSSIESRLPNKGKITHSNLCTEILQANDRNYPFVCCLSSLNLRKYHEYKGRFSEVVKSSIHFLDAVISHFYSKSKDIPGMEPAANYALNSRALGLGCLGFHSLLQSMMLPYSSISAKILNKNIFKGIHQYANEATKELAEMYGEPEWLEGTGRRNLTLTAIAPNRSSSRLAGGISQGIEPIASNAWLDNSVTGAMLRKSPEFVTYLEKMNFDETLTKGMWESIDSHGGSIQHLEWIPKEDRDVFKTFKEINQMDLVTFAGDRQPYLCQGQSLNLSFPYDAPASFVNKVHLHAYKVGLPTLYYLRSESPLRGDGASEGNRVEGDYSECTFCEG